MSVSTAVSVKEYLGTTYRPDCDYLEGELLERNVGEWDHSRLQTLLTGYFLTCEKRLGILAVAEQRVQVKSNRFRVPDITVVVGSRPEGGIVSKPPFLCVEILSPSDRVEEMQERIDDYLAFGVSYVWLVNPRTRRAWIYTAAGVQEVKDGVLSTKGPDLRVDLAEIELGFM